MGWGKKDQEDKPRRDQPNHPPRTKNQPPPQRTPLDCTKCEGTGSVRTPRLEGDQDGGFDGAEVTDCPACDGSGKV